jgi:large subunit ribosomal protein L21
MYAVVEIAGQQYEVQQDETLNVALLEGNPGDMVEFDKILLTGEGTDLTVGTPYLEGMVAAKIIEHGKDEKVLVFHKKRRKGYRKLNGHRQKYTQIQITDIKIN